MNAPATTTSKSEATRAHILASALAAFRERGFERVTMREVAADAGVALGAAYYYFDSKDALVMAFYEQAQAEILPAVERVLAQSRTLEQRLRAIIQHKFDYFAPNRRLMAALSAHIDPHNPLSPFSNDTARIREQDIACFARAITDSGVKLPPSTLPYLPRLLWMYQMGLMLFWVYDRSDRQQLTALLFDKTLQMILIALKLASMPIMRPLHRQAGELLHAIYDSDPNVDFDQANQ
ncbi:MAG: TetR/AcrR family transcriptional regulator [Terriglobales bacterium]|jgi:AcrR family transcriptional regulator